MTDQNPLVELIAAYGPNCDDPETSVLRFAREILAFDDDPWQEEFLRQFGKGTRQISVRACHGPGKTAVAAVTIIYSLLFRFPQKSVATAPTRGQLEGALFAEVAKWVSQLPTALQDLLDVKSTKIVLKAAPLRSFFEVRTARAESPEALQGVHEAGGWVHIYVDEASGVPEPIFESAGGSMSGEECQTILLSNPTRTSGFFFKTHHQLKHAWYTIHVSHADSKRVSDTFVDQMRAAYGEDSNVFRVRALGEFPRSDLDTLIAFELIDQARNRDIKDAPGALRVWGLDVARYGGDSTVLIKRTSNVVQPDIRVWNGLSLMEIAGRVKREYDDAPPSLKPNEILVDVISYGAGVVDRLLEQGVPVRGVNVSETASVDTDRFRNLRAELFWEMKEWFTRKSCVLPQCDGSCPDAQKCVHQRLADELALIRYKFTSSGKLLIESKDEIKKRGFKSPDMADALMLTFAGSAAGLIHGSSAQGGMFGGNWNEPVSRSRAMV